MYFKKPKIDELVDIELKENIENIKHEENNKHEDDNDLDLEENLDDIGDYNPDDDFSQDSIRDMFDDKKGIFNMLLLFVFFIGVILFCYYRFYINY